MKLSKFNGLLLIVNLGLLAALIYLISTRSAPLTPEAPLTDLLAAPAVVEHTNILTVTNEWKWQQLESEDYRAYIARLRSIGCPEQTIRDIIIADLDQLLAPRYLSIYGRRKDLKYWQPEEEELANNFDHRAWLRQEKQIDREKREVIQELMGGDLVRERLKQKGYEDYYERRLGFLPDGKRSQVRRVLEKYEEQEQELRRREQDESLSAEEKARLKTLRSQRQAELAGVLTPAERGQLELWISPAANEVRRALYGMDATEREFNAVYNLRKAFDAQWNPDELDQGDNAARERWIQARLELDTQIRAQLGEKRYDEYKRGEDPDFHQLNAVVSRYDLPREKAAEIYEMKRMVQEAREKILTQINLLPEQKEAAIRAMAQETERAVKTALGERAFRFYQQRGTADWIRN